ncbi:glyoxalase/bleomycin resistance/dioxygenase family protein [Pseudomonas sp. FW306-02-F02-AA]|uniref:Glyoxalase n=1 Tax=Pseudomonas fluorescens TaxID=294 RepID=A0A0N9WQU7_PSEFL|nr:MULTISPECIES: VOC family protein [Pseudomonas]ALI04417.1 glyoxalase [Pseudomonas fluorescens]PMZ03894.1 glyoxalase/bleomycin resistance/dioxygenase family protein [Pseudomonas sp. FW306-02-F02-AB]PMZ08259.1 glyoxalase/bleomycin resistance/dioxygenase family protein [Pseudomonas sp. FW306-02-H06C]PMZ13999.1 glyoxalase/bleomycin resistance/dioxygenase family protein [Pseudomonas sp. FW306-02-F02-AA]PMZ21492.1 glyoxalase/bleomycin resistance/dioxygenase family protein [Pseudomonas sp. FW306-02
MKPAINAVIIYAKDVAKTSDFYTRHFGFSALPELNGITELSSPAGGIKLLLHKAAKSVKTGQACIKLVFDVGDVQAFKDAAAAKGLHFGATHEAEGYSFSNAKDPDQNNVSISSRAFRS